VRHPEAGEYGKNERESREREYCFAGRNLERRSDHERYDCPISPHIGRPCTGCFISDLIVMPCKSIYFPVVYNKW